MLDAKALIDFPGDLLRLCLLEAFSLVPTSLVVACGSIRANERVNRLDIVVFFAIHIG